MGSLFKLRDLWSVKYGDEEFDVRSMAVGPVDDDNGQDKIVVGSFQGMLRVFHPKQKGFKPEDLLLEFNLGLPILQVSVGKYTPNSRGLSVAILTPRKLIVGCIARVGSGGSDAQQDVFAKQCDFRKEFEHHLEHTSYNFCTGAFGTQGANDGKTTPCEQLCVQSMDGQLSIFDHNKHILSRYLPSSSFLCPGWLEYIPKLDAFVTSTSTFEVELYKFGNLASSTASESKEDRQGRKLTPDWSFNTGEDAVSISVARLTTGLLNYQIDIIVMCEHTIFCLDEAGAMRWNKRLEFAPSCSTTYPVKGGRDQVLVGTHAGSLSVLSDKSVEWSAKGTAVPLNVRVMTACKTEGMMAVLADDGTVSVNYFGTDPANNPVQVLESKELDYDAMDEEHRRLQLMIRQAVNHGRQEPRDQLMLAVDASQPAKPDRSVTVVLHVSYRGGDDLDGVVVTVNCQDPIVANQHTHVVPYLPTGENVEIPVTLHLGVDCDKLTPVSLMCEAVACYTAANGEPATAKANFLVPLGVVGGPIEAVKNTAFKLQIDTNQAAANLAELFGDLTARSSDVGDKVLSFQYGNAVDATIIASKNAGRYRVQSSCFDGLWLLASELIRRLKAMYGPGLAIEFPDPLPLPEYFDVIDTHFQARLKLQQHQQTLAELAQQFRAVQKRLLVRFRERNPTPINSLELLFDETFALLQTHADGVVAAQQEVELRNNQLCCATHVLLLVSRYKFQEQMRPDDFDAFRHFLSPAVHNNPSQGWEEVTDAAMTHLLRTVLSKNARESATAPQPLQMPTDTSKLKKHISLVYDRIGKGMGAIREATAQGAAKQQQQQ